LDGAALGAKALRIALHAAGVFYPIAGASLADGMTKLTAAIWNDLRELLTVNGVAPTLPPVPLLSFFFGNEPAHSIYFCAGTSLLRYPIPAHQIIGVALSGGNTWLLQLDLEGEKRIALSCSGG
jgi:hypothetical protein